MPITDLSEFQFNLSGHGSKVLRVKSDATGLELATVPAGSTDWSTITNKPTTFTPATHLHAIADVTGLQTALDGKQASGSYATTATATISAAGLMSATDKSKLDGIATGATANSTDASLRDRSTHTGSQAAGTITGLSAFATGLTTGTSSLAFGYGTGAGGTVTQATSKATAVTLNRPTGDITLNAASLAAATVVTFQLNNSVAAAGDMVLVSHHSGGTVGPYLINGRVTGAGVISIAVRNTSAAALAEAIVIKFALIKAASA